MSIDSDHAIINHCALLLMNAAPDSTHYRGRFAPTPSGPLHMGSLVTALASWLDARAKKGQWLLRIDDLDHLRCPAGTEQQILKQLEGHGLQWDEAPRRQSDHLAEYEAALAQLAAQGRLYECSCTRAQLAATSHQGVDGPVYAGTCREGAGGEGRRSLRFRVPPGEVVLDDAIQGLCRRSNEDDIGDFVVRRNDGIHGYHLACAVDEQAQRITHIVRGADLLASTLCQRLLQDALGCTPPAYAHLPVLVDIEGRKLSKQNHAAPIVVAHAGGNLLNALALLAQQPPIALQDAPPPEVLAWAVAHWAPERLPRQATLGLSTRMPYS
jgi:glutamyl-Q tRNA(Asp) synthetase